MAVLAHGRTFSFVEWDPHPEVWVLIVGLASAYLYAISRAARRTTSGDAAVGRWQVVSFMAALVALWAASDWPVHELSEGYLLSVHMLQHLVFALVVPPLLLLGAPKWMLRRVLAPRPVQRVVRTVTRPLVALVLFNAAIVGVHWPWLVDVAVGSEPVHVLTHAWLLGAALAMWWPVVAPLPEYPSLPEPAKMFYLFLQSIVPTVPASFLTFAEQPLYASYDGASVIWTVSVLTDQRVAGLLMKLLGGLLLWFAIAVIFFRWSARENKGDVDPISWEDFERELDAWNMRK